MWAWWFLLSFLALSVPAAADAEEAGPRPPSNDATSFVAFELGLSAPTTGTDLSVVALVPRLLARAGLGVDTEVSLDLGLSIVQASVARNDETAVRVANPAFTAQYRYRARSSDFLIGLGVTVPAARLGENRTEGSVAYSFGSGIEGLWSFWRWAPETFTMFIPTKWISDVSPVLRFELESAAAIYVPTSGDATIIGFQSAARLAYVIERSWIGLGVQGAVLVLPDVPDTAQVALVPQVHWAIDSLFVDARLIVNVDEPLGFAFDRGKLWGLFTGVGVEL